MLEIDAAKGENERNDQDTLTYSNPTTSEACGVKETKRSPLQCFFVFYFIFIYYYFFFDIVILVVLV